MLKKTVAMEYATALRSMSAVGKPFVRYKLP